MGLTAAQAGLPFYFDRWDGYPAARALLLDAAREADANLVVLSGDSHNGWAFDLDSGSGTTPVGVEFAGHSVTSPRLENYLSAPPEQVAGAIVAHNRQLLWANTYRRGYLTVELTHEQATGEWTFLHTIVRPSCRGGPPPHGGTAWAAALCSRLRWPG